MRSSSLIRRWCATAAVVVLGGAGAVAAGVAAPLPAYASDVSDFTLGYEADSSAGYIAMQTASMTSVLDDGLYQAVPGGSACSAAKGTATVSSYYCFDLDDTSSWNDPNAGSAWVPQGVSTVSDSVADESWNGKSAIIVAWYHTGANGVRISVLNKTTGSYRHILLVDPYYDGSSHASYQAVDIHAGGILWYGRYLYVVDTNNGVRVFSMDYIYDLGASTNGTTSCSYIGYVGGVYCAAAYKYVMPQVGFWKTASPSSSSGFCKAAGGNPRFSYITVDRATVPDRLVTGEFCEVDAEVTGRLAAYPMASAVPGGGVSTLIPSKVYKLPTRQIQGAAYNGSAWFFNRSHGGGQGELLRATGTSTLTQVATKTAPIGPEDLSLWRSTGRVWSVTEYKSPGRMLYSQSLP